MSLTVEQVDFLKSLKAPIDASALFETTRVKKNVLIEQALAFVPDEKTLRETLDFSVKSKSGKSEVKAIPKDPTKMLDTEEAVAKTQGLTPEQHVAITRILQQYVFPAVDKLLDAKGPDGESSLFDVDEIAQEVFEPLKRKGLFPETLIPDQYSVVQKYINAALQRYKQTLKDRREEKIRDAAKLDLDARGMGTATDRLKGRIGQAQRGVDKVTDIVAGNALLRGIAGGETGTKEERARGLQLTGSAVSMTLSIASAGSAISGYATGKTEATIERSQTVGKFVDANGKPDKAAEASFVFTFGKQLTMVLGADAAQQAALGLESTYQSISGLATLVPGGISAALQIKGIASDQADKIEQAAALARWETLAAKSMAAVPALIDDVLATALGKSAPLVGIAIAGAYAESVDVWVLDDAVRQAEPDGAAVIKELAGAFPKALEKYNPGGDAGPAFRKVGEAMAKAFTVKLNAKDVSGDLEFDKAGKRAPDDVVGRLLAAARAAVSKAAGLPPDTGETGEEPEDGGAADSFKKALTDPATGRAMQATAAQQEKDALLDEMDRAEKESKDFEDRLTLIDDEGALLAEQNTIERLIAEIEKEKQMLELAAGAVSTLSGALGSGVSIGKAAVGTAAHGVTTATEALGGFVLPALKLAKLITKLTVNIIRAAERIKLLMKFETQVNRAINAGSPLSTTVRGFYQNKQEQVAHHTVQDALIAVQIAGTVMELSHYPPVMAAGKLVGAIGSAAESAEQFAYDVADEAKLRKGWRVTKAAYRNPKNRRVGLLALQLNTTLAMHGVAWAAKEQKDPVAIEFLKACGLSERNLATNNTTEAKIRDYMMALLSEDRVYLDTEKVSTNWQPAALEATSAGWVVLRNRAQTKAEPKLNQASTSGIDAAFKAADKDRQDLKALVDAAPADRLKLIATGTPDLARVKTARANATAIGKALDAYKPLTEAGSRHDEMDAVVGQVKALVDDWRDTLDIILVQSGQPIPDDEEDEPTVGTPKPVARAPTSRRRRPATDKVGTEDVAPQARGGRSRGGAVSGGD